MTNLGFVVGNSPNVEVKTIKTVAEDSMYFGVPLKNIWRTQISFLKLKIIHQLSVHEPNRKLWFRSKVISLKEYLNNKIFIPKIESL